MAKHRRGRSKESPTVDLLPVTLADVYLLTAESDGQLAVGGLALVVDHRGLSVFAPDGTAAAELAWSELTALRTAGPATAPGGEDAVLLEAASALRTHVFAVPTSDAAALETTVAAIAGAAEVNPPRRARRRR
jgi:hypothetical protein